jgi:hypothetical protein
VAQTKLRIFSWEPRENIGEGCKDLLAHVERTAAFAPEAAVGTEVEYHSYFLTSN